MPKRKRRRRVKTNSAYRLAYQSAVHTTKPVCLPRSPCLPSDKDFSLPLSVRAPKTLAGSGVISRAGGLTRHEKMVSRMAKRAKGEENANQRELISKKNLVGC